MDQDTYRRDFSKTVWDFFRSVRTTVFLLPLITILAVAGTLIPQGSLPGLYSAVYGPTVARLILAIGMDDVFHSSLFLLALTFLGLNVLACTWERMPRVVERLKRPVPSRRSRAVEFELEPLSDLNALVPKGWQVIREDREGSLVLAVKGRWSSLSFVFVHTSLLVILFGGAVSGIFALEGDLHLAEGEKADRLMVKTGTKAGHELELGFTVRCDSVKAISEPGTGRIVQYVTDVTIIESDGENLKAEISVNTPLEYGGWRFFQSEYNEIPSGSSKTTRVTGLRVARDPGAGIVWLGSGLLVLGLVLVLVKRKGLELALQDGGKVKAIVFGDVPEWSLERERERIERRHRSIADNGSSQD